MALPQTNDELLAAITLEFGKLRKALDDIPEGIVHERTMEGHAKSTMMSPFDLVAYLTSWNELVLKWLDRYAALYGRGWYETWTMGRMIQFNTSSPYANARGRLRK
jgi:hypothetical protein